MLISLRALAPRSRASGSKEGAAAAAAAGVFSQSASEAAPVMPTAASIDETAETAAADDDEEEALLASAAALPPAVRIRLAAASAAVRNISKKGGRRTNRYARLRATPEESRKKTIVKKEREREQSSFRVHRLFLVLSTPTRSPSSSCPPRRPPGHLFLHLPARLFPRLLDLRHRQAPDAVEAGIQEPVGVVLRRRAVARGALLDVDAARAVGGGGVECGGERVSGGL